MKHIHCIQNSEEWFRERLGKLTASEFHRLIKKDGGLSAQRFDYMYQLIFERIYRKRANQFSPNFWMDRGKRLEPVAAEAIEQYLGRRIFTVGLLTTDDGRLACSPDRIIDWTHAVEIKCPKPWQHMQYTVLGPVQDYYQQIHGIMWIGNFDKVSFYSFCPGMPCKPHVVHRDERLMKTYDAMLPLLADELDRHEKAVREMGDYADFDLTTEPAIAWEPEAS